VSSRLNFYAQSISLINVLFFLDSSMEDQETPKMLRACYQYALCEELCQNRGQEEGKRICSKILQVCSIN